MCDEEINIDFKEYLEFTVQNKETLKLDNILPISAYAYLTLFGCALAYFVILYAMQHQLPKT